MSVLALYLTQQHLTYFLIRYGKTDPWSLKSYFLIFLVAHSEFDVNKLKNAPQSITQLFFCNTASDLRE